MTKDILKVLNETYANLLSFTSQKFHGIMLTIV